MSDFAHTFILTVLLIINLSFTIVTSEVVSSEPITSYGSPYNGNQQKQYSAGAYVYGNPSQSGLGLSQDSYADPLTPSTIRNVDYNGKDAQMFNYHIYQNDPYYVGSNKYGSLARQDFGNGGDDGGGEFGLFGLLGLLGLGGLADLIGRKTLKIAFLLLPFIAPIIDRFLAMLILPFVVLAILLLPLLLFIMVPIVILPVPADMNATVPMPAPIIGRNFIENTWTVTQSFAGTECAERVACEMSKAAKLYGLDSSALENFIKKSTTETKWLDRISRALEVHECTQYKCPISNPWKKVTKKG